MNHEEALPSEPMGDFPPYGFLNAVERIPPDEPLAPPDFDGDVHVWNMWFDGTLKLINDLLWPNFDQRSLKWVGRSVASMRLLTETDLALLVEIRAHQKQIFDQPITTPVGALGRSTHRTLYHLEDGFIQVWGTYYADYDATLPPNVSRNFVAMIRAGVDGKVADTDMRFKVRLQRPRPYQMAFILKKDAFDYEEGQTANTPSMCCGHCMEGLLGIGGIMEQIIQSGVNLSYGSWEALEQYAVDIGDRRVMAGVHYPSDALCSWLISLRLTKHVFKVPRKVKPHLWTAIRYRSFVYRLIAQAIKDGKGDCYRAAMDALQEEANRED